MTLGVSWQTVSLLTESTAVTFPLLPRSGGCVLAGGESVLLSKADLGWSCQQAEKLCSPRANFWQKQSSQTRSWSVSLG